MSNFEESWLQYFDWNLTWIENYPEYDLATGGHSNSASDAFCHRGRGEDRVGKRDTQGGFFTPDCFKQTLQEFTILYTSWRWLTIAIDIYWFELL